MYNPRLTILYCIYFTSKLSWSLACFGQISCVRAMLARSRGGLNGSPLFMEGRDDFWLPQLCCSAMRAKVFNIKQMAAALAYIQDNGLTDYEQLAQKATEATDHFHVLSEQIKQTEQTMKTNAGLKAATVQYAKARPVFEQYKAAKYSRKFLAEHEADIELYRAAQAEMRRLLGGAKLPKMDALKEEGRKLTAKKKRLYGEYQKARWDMQEIVTIKANIDTLLGYTEPGRKQEKER